MTNRLAAAWRFALAGALLTLAACGGGAEAPPEVEGQVQVWVDDFAYTRQQSGTRYLSGKLVNESGQAIRSAQIQVSLFDPDNRRVSTMHITVQDVEPGARKAFREPLDTDAAIRSARVRSIMIL